MSFAQLVRQVIKCINDDEGKKAQWELFLGIMMEAGNKLLSERERYTETDDKPYDEVRPIDIEITELIHKKLSEHPELCDVFCSEDREPGKNVEEAKKVVPVDAVDNTKGYVDRNRKDFASALIRFNMVSGEVDISIFILPAMEIVYCAFGFNKVWKNNLRLPLLSSLVRENIGYVLRKPRGGIGDNILKLYAQAEQEFQNRNYASINGQEMTALDVLSLAEGKKPAKFLYYAKSWDFLPAAFIAFCVGAKVTYYPSKEPVFPLSEIIITKIMATKQKREGLGERDLFLVEWPED